MILINRKTLLCILLVDETIDMLRVFVTCKLVIKFTTIYQVHHYIYYTPTVCKCQYWISSRSILINIGYLTMPHSNLHNYREILLMLTTEIFLKRIPFMVRFFFRGYSRVMLQEKRWCSPIVDASIKGYNTINSFFFEKNISLRF